jgi:hydrogenase/urease accessory protein HupE
LSARRPERSAASFAFAATLAAVSTLSTRAEAHRIGLSQGDYSVSGDRVESRLVFAATELISAVPGLDSDADGHLSTPEIRRQTEALRSKISDRLAVSRKDKPCKGTLESASPSSDDGVILVLRHDCDPGSGEVAVELGFLTGLERGHRHIARIAGLAGTSEVVTYDGHSRLSFGSTTGADTRSPVLEYLRLGIEHILGGADHLLFLLGVVLLPASLRSLLLAVTAFTLSHSVSLVLSTLGLVHMSGAWVEPLIALSVAYIGIENWFLKDASRRWRLTFAFGFVHGLGFASALRDASVPPNRLPVALASFNIGVELGQLLVVAALWLVVTRIHWRGWYRPWVLGTASIALFLVGAVWSIERTGLLREPIAAVRAEPGRTSGIDEGNRSARSSNASTPPLVARLCQSLSELPRVRRAECSHTKPGISLASQCSRMLGESVASGAVSLVETEVDRCLEEWTRRYEGCSFVERTSLPSPASCEHVLAGNLSAEATCRSSLECASGLHCDGVGPLDSGRCRPPRAEGSSCGLSVDPLLAYVGAAGVDRPECIGACVNNRCRAAGS